MELEKRKYMTRKELLSAPARKWDEKLQAVCVYVIPNGRKHESGWACMDFVAETEDGLIRFGGSCDSVSFRGENFMMDCLYPSRIIRIWSRGNILITEDLSSIDFIEE